MPDAVADLEGQQVGFAHGPHADDGIHQTAAAFLVVDGVVLQFNDGAGEDRVLAMVLKIASVAEFPGQVDAAGKAHVVALRALLPANQRSILAGGLRVPARCRCQVRGQRGGITAVHCAEAHSIG